VAKAFSLCNFFTRWLKRNGNIRKISEKIAKAFSLFNFFTRWLKRNGNVRKTAQKVAKLLSELVTKVSLPLDLSNGLHNSKVNRLLSHR
jgi:hypothetical protein